VGNIDPQANEELIWELFVQAGPVGGCWDCYMAASGLGGRSDSGAGLLPLVDQPPLPLPP
jgi:hypothetical protein